MRSFALLTTALSLMVYAALIADTANLTAPQIRWGENSRIGKLYNPNTFEEHAGTVISFQQTKPRLARWHALVVFLKTPKDDHLEVHLGPQWFLEENALDLQINDTVYVSGSKVTVEDRKFLVANKITKGDKTLVLRKDDGKPVWVKKTLRDKRAQRQSRQAS